MKKNWWGDIGEELARKHVLEALWPWREAMRPGKEDWCLKPEDMLSLIWFGQQPWVTRVEGEALQILKELAALEREPGEDLYTALGMLSFSAFSTLLRLRFEGRLHEAIEMIQRPEVYCLVGDVLELGPTREEELEAWVEASDRNWNAYAGVKQLLKRLRDWEHPIPDALARWSEEVESGARAQPTIGHRPVSVIYRDGAEVKTIRDLTDRQFWGMSGIAAVSVNKACKLIAGELQLDEDYVKKIWQKGKDSRDHRFIAPPNVRPF